ncbi:hypothetical protein JXI42_06465 [bacterium]|nr:hypothetical protein [bacterium]
MGYFESTIVVYLRELFYPAGFQFPMVKISETLLFVEIGREFFSLIMILTVALLSSENKWKRFANFMFIFAIWDITFYLWLRLFLHWPSSVFTWDLLFLLPVPWAGPVIAPLLISLTMILGWLIINLRIKTLNEYKFPAMFWVLEILGVSALLISFMDNFTIIINYEIPQSFNWATFAGGWILSFGTFVFYISTNKLLKKRT